MSIKLLNMEPVEWSDSDFDMLRAEIGLCEDEDVSLYLDAAVSKVEGHMNQSLRKRKIKMQTTGGDYHTLPFAPVKKIDSIVIKSGGYNLSARDDYVGNCGFCKSHFNKCCGAMSGNELPLCLPPLFGCGCAACACDREGTLYEICYTTGPEECIDPLIKLAVFKVAKHLYDEQGDPPDLDKMLKNFAPTEMDKFYGAVGGMFTRVA